jgi:hypothetical protein
MGSLERARQIAKDFGAFGARKLVEKGLERCGNCLWRYNCLQQILPMKAILIDLSTREEYADHAGVVAKVAAHFLKDYCFKGCMGAGGGDLKMPRCIGYLCTYCECPELTESIVARACAFSMNTEDLLARRIQASMDRNINNPHLLRDAAAMLKDCVKEHKFAGGVICREAPNLNEVPYHLRHERGSEGEA